MTIRDLQKLVDNLGEYYIEIGVLSGRNKVRKEKLTITTTNKKGETKTSTKTVESGVTNADILFIAEHGSIVNHIPKRPVLQMTIEYAKKELYNIYVKQAVKAYFATGKREEFEKPLKIMAMKMESYARDIIYKNDGRLARNAPSTIRAKGFNHPLFITGQLARSIHCRLVKKDMPTW